MYLSISLFLNKNDGNAGLQVFWLVVSTHLKNISQNGFIFPKFRDENKTYLKPPPSFSCLVHEKNPGIFVAALVSSCFLSEAFIQLQSGRTACRISIHSQGVVGNGRTKIAQNFVVLGGFEGVILATMIWLVVEPTPLKNMLVKMDHFPK